jgi:DNA anti-recombination protein RmuC
MFCVAYVFGRKGAINLWKTAQLEKDQYKIENETLRKQQEIRKEDTKKAKEKFNKTAEALREERDRRLESIEDDTTEEVLKNLGIKKI